MIKNSNPSVEGSQRSFGSFISAALVLIAIAGCSAGGVPPVSDRSRVTSTAASPGQYVVVAGDTLYSIAWRHQRDFKTLAALNRIRKPYDIYPGQRLQIKGAVSPETAAVVSRPRTRLATKQAPTTAVVAAKTPAVPHPLSQTQPKPQRQAAVRAPQPKTNRSVVKPAASAVAPARSLSGPVKLSWPGSGKRLRSFGERPEGAQKPSVAINFLLQPGASIRASAAGEVVYVGRGLAGFEQFVIVKHNDTWLSAYGFNAPAAVREKQRLSSGTVLATLARGQTGATSEERNWRRQLHFELRKNGTPVNPATVIN